MPENVDEIAKRMREAAEGAAKEYPRYEDSVGPWEEHWDASDPANVLAILDDRAALTSLLEKAGGCLSKFARMYDEREYVCSDGPLRQARSVLSEIEAYRKKPQGAT